MPCECSSIKFGTVAEVFDRDCLQVIDPGTDCQDVEAPADEVLTKEDSNNPPNLIDLGEFVELKADVDEVQAELEEVLDLETAASCHKLQNGSSIRKTNESVDGTEKEVLTNLKEPLTSFEECSVKVPAKCRQKMTGGSLQQSSVGVLDKVVLKDLHAQNGARKIAPEIMVR